MVRSHDPLPHANRYFGKLLFGCGNDLLDLSTLIVANDVMFLIASSLLDDNDFLRAAMFLLVIGDEEQASGVLHAL